MSPANLDPSISLPTAALPALRLHNGGHKDRSNGLCAMEVVSWLAGEPHSDTPQCTCPVIGAFMRAWNDNLSEEDRDRLLKPLLPRLLNTRSTREVEDRRSWLAFDWLVREYAPAWLVTVKDLEAHGARLRGLPEVRDLATARAAAAEAQQADTAATAAWSAARSAAESAAWSAARSAVRDVLQPTERTLQDSAFELVERMLAVSPESVRAEGWDRRVVEESITSK